MSDPVDALHGIVHAHRNEIVDQAVAWVASHASHDLRAPGDLADTRRLVERLVAAYERALFEGDRGALDEFVDYVTTFRATREFRISTLLRGLLSFRTALQAVLLRELTGDARVAEMLARVDAIAFDAVFVGADDYTAKILESVRARKQELERELRDLDVRRQRETRERAAAVERQRHEVLADSLVLVPLGHRTLVLPVPRDLDTERLDAALPRLLERLAARRPYALVVDLTSPGDDDEPLARLLGAVSTATRLGGSSWATAGLDAARLRGLQEREPRVADGLVYGALQEALLDVLDREEGASNRRRIR